MIGDKPAEQDPLRTAALLRAIGQVSVDLIFAKDREGRFIYANPAAAAVAGVPLDQMLGRTNLELSKEPEQARRIMDSDRAIMEAGFASVLEESWTSPGGRKRTFRSAKAPMRAPDGEVIGLAGVSTDITERKASEQTLRETEERYRLAVLATNDAVWDWDLTSNQVLWNEALERAYGHDLNSVIKSGDWWLEHIHPDDRERISASIHHAIDSDEPGWSDEYRFRRADGSYAEVMDRGTVIRDASGRACRMIGAMLDLSELRRTEERLRESERRLRMATDAASIGTWDYDPENDMLDWDERTKALFGLAPDAPVDFTHTFADGLHPEDREATLEAVSTALAPDGAGSYDVEYRTVGREDGVVRWIAATGRALFEDGKAVRFVGTVRDITARKIAEEGLRQLNETLEQRIAEAIAQREEAQEALRQAQKMEAVGQLTGGIAHDFNNLLTVVIGNLDLARRALGAGDGNPRGSRAIEAAQKGAERAASLTQRLLAFARRQPLDPKPIEVDRLLLGMSDLLDRALGETVQIEVVSSPGLWRIEADPNQLEAAILNLAVNARDAMEDGGHLTIETSNVRLDEDYSAQQAEVPPGQYVVIAVSDTGTGMAREVQARVFEPFFTTKNVGRGTGLGLSQVYGFVKQSGGNVKIYSEEGEGTTVKLYFPRLLAEGSAEEAHAEPLASAIGSQEETLLVVEDDDDVRSFTVESLRTAGYRVLEAHDGASALRLMERQAEPIDLLFTDVVMPGMSGRELADRARDMQPGLRVLYTSGYTRDAIARGGRLETGVDMIAKPFTYEALCHRVRDALDRGRTGRLLLVRAEPFGQKVTDALTGGGYAIDAAADGSEAIGRARANRGRYDAVIIEGRIPGRSAGGLIDAVRSLYRHLPVLRIVDDGKAEKLAVRFASDPCTAVLEGPVEPEQMLKALDDLGVRCAAAD